MTPILLGLGSNMGDSLSILQKAVREIKKKYPISSVSSLYQSAPYGYVEQDEFLNAVLAIESSELPSQLLKSLLAIETELGRIRKFKWGPRLIDLDIIFYGSRLIKQKNLTVPHQDFHNRDFVIIPAAEIWPEFIPPGFSQNLQQMAQNFAVTSNIKKIKKKWTQ